MNMKEKRKKRGFTQSHVAIKVGLSLQGYQLIERGVTRNPKKETLKKIMAVLDGN